MNHEAYVTAINDETKLLVGNHAQSLESAYKSVLSTTESRLTTTMTTIARELQGKVDELADITKQSEDEKVKRRKLVDDIKNSFTGPSFDLTNLLNQIKQ